MDVSVMESMLNLMEDITPEFDRKSVVRSPSSSSVMGIAATGACRCVPEPSAAPDSTLDHEIIGVNSDSMYKRA
ncbi:hypothetical protein BJY52DRAFT_1302036, partial [Lactarius psammicola]